MPAWRSASFARLRMTPLGIGEDPAVDALQDEPAVAHGERPVDVCRPAAGASRVRPRRGQCASKSAGFIRRTGRRARPRPPGRTRRGVAVRLAGDGGGVSVEMPFHAVREVPQRRGHPVEFGDLGMARGEPPDTGALPAPAGLPSPAARGLPSRRPGAARGDSPAGAGRPPGSVPSRCRRDARKRPPPRGRPVAPWWRGPSSRAYHLTGSSTSISGARVGAVGGRQAELRETAVRHGGEVRDAGPGQAIVTRGEPSVHVVDIADRGVRPEPLGDGRHPAPHPERQEFFGDEFGPHAGLPAQHASGAARGVSGRGVRCPQGLQRLEPRPHVGEPRIGDEVGFRAVLWVRELWVRELWVRKIV